MRLSNKDIIEKRLREDKPVNTVDAVRGLYGPFILRLSDIIFKLRNEGMNIDTVRVQNTSNSNSTAKYFIKKGKKKHVRK